MDAKQLGNRLREARLAKKMTQSDVVGDFITRNMLSQIESGNAVPSMKTLDYLANVLNLSPSELLSEQTSTTEGTSSGEELLLTIANEKESMLYQNAREHVVNGKYMAALNLLPALREASSFSEEATYLTCRCALQLAKELAQLGSLAEALDYAKLAEQYAGVGLFGSLAQKNEALKLMAELAAALITTEE